MLNSDTVNQNAKIQTETKQIETLLYPIKDEEARMQIIMQKFEPDRVIEPTDEDRKLDVSSEAKSAHAALQNISDEKTISQHLKQIDVENEVKRREVDN
jgi:hypothetical protein